MLMHVYLLLVYLFTIEKTGAKSRTPPPAARHPALAQGAESLVCITSCLSIEY